MLITHEGLTRRLEDGRWRQVSWNAVSRRVDDPRYECQLRYTARTWQPAEPALINERPNMRYRIRLRPEFLQSPFREEYK